MLCFLLPCGNFLRAIIAQIAQPVNKNLHRRGRGMSAQGTRPWLPAKNFTYALIFSPLYDKMSS